MKVDKEGEALRLTLTPDEVRLLKHALERASFMDTPASEQADIARFCDTLLQDLASSDDAGGRK